MSEQYPEFSDPLFDDVRDSAFFDGREEEESSERWIDPSGGLDEHGMFPCTF